MLEQFEQYNMVNGIPAISISENGVGFNPACVAKMNMCNFVKVFVDNTNNRIAIQIADKNDDGAVSFFTNQKSKTVRWNQSDFLRMLSKMMQVDFSKKVYRVCGEYCFDEKAMVFDLKAAKKIK